MGKGLFEVLGCVGGAGGCLSLELSVSAELSDNVWLHVEGGRLGERGAVSWIVFDRVFEDWVVVHQSVLAGRESGMTWRSFMPWGSEEEVSYIWVLS